MIWIHLPVLWIKKIKKSETSMPDVLRLVSWYLQELCWSFLTKTELSVVNGISCAYQWCHTGDHVTMVMFTWWLSQSMWLDNQARVSWNFRKSAWGIPHNEGFNSGICWNLPKRNKRKKLVCYHGYLPMAWIPGDPWFKLIDQYLNYCFPQIMKLSKLFLLGRFSGWSRVNCWSIY